MNSNNIGFNETAANLNCLACKSDSGMKFLWSKTFIKKTSINSDENRDKTSISLLSKKKKKPNLRLSNRQLQTIERWIVCCAVQTNETFSINMNFSSFQAVLTLKFQNSLCPKTCNTPSHFVLRSLSITHRLRHHSYIFSALLKWFIALPNDYWWSKTRRRRAGAEGRTDRKLVNNSGLRKKNLYQNIFRIFCPSLSDQLYPTN